MNFENLFVDRTDRNDFTSEVNAALRQLANWENYSPYSECCYTRTGYVDETPAFDSFQYTPDPLMD